MDMGHRGPGSHVHECSRSRGATGAGCDRA